MCADYIEEDDDDDEEEDYLKPDSDIATESGKVKICLDVTLMSIL